MTLPSHLPRLALFMTGTLLLAACSSPPAPIAEPATQPASARPIGAYTNVNCQMVSPDFPGNGQFGGNVTLAFEVSETGAIEKITIVRSSGHLLLDDSAIRALRRSRCRPYRIDGKPTRVRFVQPYEFQQRVYPTTDSDAWKAARAAARHLGERRHRPDLSRRRAGLRCPSRAEPVCPGRRELDAGPAADDPRAASRIRARLARRHRARMGGIHVVAALSGAARCQNLWRIAARTENWLAVADGPSVPIR